eukprot:132747-Chlamydomonas_euryale.AAC.1
MRDNPTRRAAQKAPTQPAAPDPDDSHTKVGPSRRSAAALACDPTPARVSPCRSAAAPRGLPLPVPRSEAGRCCGHCSNLGLNTTRGERESPRTKGGRERWKGRGVWLRTATPSANPASTAGLPRHSDGRRRPALRRRPTESNGDRPEILLTIGADHWRASTQLHRPRRPGVRTAAGKIPATSSQRAVRLCPVRCWPEREAKLNAA